MTAWRPLWHSAFMRLLSTVGKRLWDAVHAFVAVLLGRLTPRRLTPTQRVKHAAALQTDLLEVASLLEKMHAWTSRMAARDSRAAKKILDADADVAPVGAASGPTPPLSGKDRKAMLRAYMTAKNFGFPGVPPPPPPAPEQRLELEDLNGDGALEVEDET